MKKNLEALEKIYELRYKTGKVHLFYSINKLVGKFGDTVALDKIYVSKDYLSYLSEKMFQDKDRITGYFGGNNKFLRLSLVQEFMGDYEKDIAQEIKDDFMDMKQFNSSVFKPVKQRIEALKENEAEDISFEDIELMEGYLKNWKRLLDKIRYFIPEEFYGRKNNYLSTVLLNYIKFLENSYPQYEAGMKYLEEIK